MTNSRNTLCIGIAERCRRFIRSDGGPTSVEYAVMLAMILVVCIGAITTVGGETFNFWDHIRTAIESIFN